MKIWFDYCRHYEEFGPEIKLGIHWFKHSVPNKRFKPWKGLTIIFYLIRWQLYINIVDDYKAYLERINYKSSGHIRKKKDVT